MEEIIAQMTVHEQQSTAGLTSAQTHHLVEVILVILHPLNLRLRLNNYAHGRKE